MSELDTVKLASSKSKGKRPYFFDDPAVERVLSITMAVVAELAVARERIDTIERLLEKRELLSREEIEAFVPDKETAAERGRWHQEYLSRVLRIVQQELEALQGTPNEQSSEDVAEELSRS